MSASYKLRLNEKMTTGQVIDETGNIYGRLTVLGRAHSAHYGGAQWLCKCKCGNETIVLGRSLRNGDTKSCGCLVRENAKDEIGNSYGRLTVLERYGSNKQGNATWLCECQCGERTVVVGILLRTGQVQSCGCLQREGLPEGVAAFNKYFSGLKRDAKKRGYNFDLTADYVRFLTHLPCHYCGKEPSQIMRADNGNYIYNGLDRVDSGKAYTKDNIVPCCGRCNTAKRTMEIGEFAAWITKVYDHFAGAWNS